MKFLDVDGMLNQNKFWRHYDVISSKVFGLKLKFFSGIFFNPERVYPEPVTEQIFYL